jgi:uncharacterized protein (DUF1501 family)
MLGLECNPGVRSCDGLTRRDFLRAGSLAVGLGLTELAHLQQLGAAPKTDKACIQLFLVGGPGHLDTWDLKPEAPAEIRGPFRPIRTNVPGIAICEHFPRMARLADRFAIVRSLYHREAPIHETGQQLLQTGRLHQGGIEWPHYGAVVGKLGPSDCEVPPWVVAPAPIGNTGVSVSHGQSAGFLGSRHEPLFLPPDGDGFAVGDRSAAHGLDPARLTRRSALVEAVDAAQSAAEGCAADDSPARQAALGELTSPRAKRAFDLAAEPDAVRDRYGWNTFGQSCLLARRLVQHGVRLVTVNMFDTVFGQVTWDCHANGGDLSTTLDDYRETLCPMLDAAYTALLEDLTDLGLLESTLVLAMGEFGRTPKLNGRNGRDHWPGVWSGLLAGGGVRGGQVLGASDRHGEEPKERPVHAAEIAATVYHALGIDPRTRLLGADGRSLPLLDAEPVRELF